MNQSHSHLPHRRRTEGEPVVTAIQRPAVVRRDTVAHTTATRVIQVDAMTQAEEVLS